MATYMKATMTDPLNVAAEPRCDDCSVFDGEGFSLPLDDGQARAWDPHWGGPCGACGSPC